MKNLIKSLIYGLTVLVGGTMVSCHQPDSVVDSIPYDRVLKPLNVEGEVNEKDGKTVTIKWQGMQNAESYIVEIYSGVGEDEAEPNYPDYNEDSNSDCVVCREVSGTSLKIVATDAGDSNFDGLLIDHSYYVRVRGLNDDLTDSKWAYFENSNGEREDITTYYVRETLLPEVVSRESAALEIKWVSDGTEFEDADGMHNINDSEELSSVRIEPVLSGAGWSSAVVKLTAEEIAAHSAVITSERLAEVNSKASFAAATQYKLTLLYGKAGPRGSVTAWTRPQIVDGAIRVSSAQSFVDAVKDATDPVTIVVEYSEQPYDITSIVGVDANNAIERLGVNTSVTIIGEDTNDGLKPVLNGVLFEIKPSCTSFHIENVALDGSWTYGDNSGQVSRVVEFTATEGANVENIDIVNCDVYGYSIGLLYLNVDNTVNTFTVDGTYVVEANPEGKNGGDFIDIRKGTLANTVIKNSTFDSCGRGFFRYNANHSSVIVTNCTFNACVMNKETYRMFDIRGNMNANVVCDHCLFLNEKNDDADFCAMVRVSGDNVAPLCSYNYYYNIGENWFPAKSAAKAVISGSSTLWSDETATKDNNSSILSTDPCSNSEFSKFYLKNQDIIKNKVGDPRWWNAEEPFKSRAKELVAFTTPLEETDYNWDFTNREVWEQEALLENTIIENIQILAPATVTANTGIRFTQAATVNRSGVPSAAALEIKVGTVGKLGIKTLNAGGTADVKVMVNTTYLKSVPADGNIHYVTLGDILDANTSVYLYSENAKGVTFTQLDWVSLDTETEDSKTPLATPEEIVLSAANVEEGEDSDLVISWDKVSGAATYKVTFSSATAVVDESTTAETTYTVAGATIGSLEAADYEISVVAVPAETSTLYSESAAGTVKFSVDSAVWPEEGWVFANEPWKSVIGDGFDLKRPYSVKKQGLTIFNPEDSGGNSKCNKNGFYDTNDGSGNKNGKTLQFMFDAPAGDWRATVNLKLSGNNSYASPVVGIRINETGEYKEYVVSKDISGCTDRTDVELDFTISEASTINISAIGRVEFYSIKCEAVVAESVEAPEWVFETTEVWKAVMEADFKDADGKYGNIVQKNYDKTAGGLRLYSNDADLKGADSGKAFQMASGGVNKQFFSFNAISAGTLTVVAAGTGGSPKDDQRTVNVQTGDDASSMQTQISDGASSQKDELEYNITVNGPTTIYIWSSKGHRIYSVKYTGSIKP